MHDRDIVLKELTLQESKMMLTIDIRDKPKGESSQFHLGWEEGTIDEALPRKGRLS